ncbi:hypothetical protein DFH09DRAFT_932917, partial [Mycena vulgaris]
LRETVANDMPLDLVWLFTVPIDNQAAPRSRAVTSGPPHVPVGPLGRRPRAHRALRLGDTIASAGIIEYPAGAVADDTLYHFTLEDFTRVRLPGYTHEGAGDALFPVDRVWVARNLIKGWYARADVLVAAEDRRGPGLGDRHGSGLGDLIWADIGGARGAKCTAAYGRHVRRATAFGGGGRDAVG